MSPIERNYCLDCDWSADIEEHGREALARLAIEHAVEYGHDIESGPSTGYERRRSLARQL